MQQESCHPFEKIFPAVSARGMLLVHLAVIALLTAYLVLLPNIRATSKRTAEPTPKHATPLPTFAPTGGQ